MAAPDHIPFRTSVEALTRPGNLRVWSLIVTIFGDLAPERGDVIAGPVLSQILEPIGIKPEAQRVALHRLRKDGWIDSTKSGRTSRYQLTDEGRAETRAAAARIYARDVSFAPNWYLLWADPGAVCVPPADAIVLGTGLFLGNGPTPPAGDFMVLEGTEPRIPAWLQARFGTPELAQAYAELVGALEEVAGALRGGVVLTPLQVATLRTLIVHNWRRLLLKHPDLPRGFFPASWQGDTCRDMVASLLEHLARPGLSELG